MNQGTQTQSPTLSNYSLSIRIYIIIILDEIESRYKYQEIRIRKSHQRWLSPSLCHLRLDESSLSSPFFFFSLALVFKLLVILMLLVNKLRIFSRRVVDEVDNGVRDNFDEGMKWKRGVEGRDFGGGRWLHVISNRSLRES